MLWVAGANALPYTLAIFIPTMAAAFVFQSYLKRNSAEYWPGKNDLVRRRGQLNILAGIFLLSGMLRAALDRSALGGIADSSTGIGMAVGAVVGALAGVAMLVYKRTQANKAELEDEF